MKSCPVLRRAVVNRSTETSVKLASGENRRISPSNWGLGVNVGVAVTGVVGVGVGVLVWVCVGVFVGVCVGVFVGVGVSRNQQVLGVVVSADAVLVRVPCWFLARAVQTMVPS